MRLFHISARKLMDINKINNNVMFVTKKIDIIKVNNNNNRIDQVSFTFF